MTACFLSSKRHSNRFRRQADLICTPIGYNSSRPARQRFDWITVDVGGPVDWNKGRAANDDLRQIVSIWNV